MVDSKGAAPLTVTLGKVFLFLLGQIVTQFLPPVTTGAEMCGPPAIPLSNGAAEAALVLDEVSTVDSAAPHVFVRDAPRTD
jgi:hypothetical protein